MPQRTLITAGPTQEVIDTVRFLSNRSSGQMGFALAQAAAELGHTTTLLLGPISSRNASDMLQSLPDTIEIQDFQSTDDLQKLLLDLWPRHDVLFMAAAVADYRPIRTCTGKMRRQKSNLLLELQPTLDLLAELAEITRPDQTVVGFALESAAELDRSARDKLQRKKLDAIVANPLETMDSPHISATIYLRSGQSLKAPPRLPKLEFARWLQEQIAVLAKS